jgi:hypothetical protein
MPAFSDCIAHVVGDRPFADVAGSAARTIVAAVEPAWRWPPPVLDEESNAVRAHGETRVAEGSVTVVVMAAGPDPARA